jgi:murein DD-endopeptidase MepM/ murein hydrolase activator NlpD
MPSKRVKIILIVFSVVILIGLSGILILGIPLNTNEPELEFPIKEQEYIEGLSSWGIDGWSGEGTHHNGIDLVINHSATIISPVKGVIIGIEETQNSHSTIQNILFSIVIMVNFKWTVKLVIEPNFPGSDTANNALQREAIKVSLRQKVEVGDQIALLLYSGYYSHLHYMVSQGGEDVCPYLYSSAAAKAIFDHISMIDGDPPCV